jgi:phosphatidylglycerophosphate synthase
MAPPPSAGEKWVADELTALRETRFTPGAIAKFLEASLERAAATRAERPALARQARRWVMAGALGMLVARDTAARLNKPVPSRRLMIGWLALEALMLDWHLGMLEGLSGASRDGLTSAEGLTLARMALAPLAAAAPPDEAWFILLLGIAGASDVLDGQLGRRAGPTRFGRDFDSLADLAFRSAAIHGARREGWIDPTSRRVLTARQALLAGRALWHWFGRSHRPPLNSSPLSRWHVPLLLGGLAISSLGRQRAGNQLLRASAIIGSGGYWRRSRGEGLNG